MRVSKVQVEVGAHCLDRAEHVVRGVVGHVEVYAVNVFHVRVEDIAQPPLLVERAVEPSIEFEVPVAVHVVVYISVCAGLRVVCGACAEVVAHDVGLGPGVPRKVYGVATERGLSAQPVARDGLQIGVVDAQDQRVCGVVGGHDRLELGLGDAHAVVQFKLVFALAELHMCIRLEVGV